MGGEMKAYRPLLGAPLRFLRQLLLDDTIAAHSARSLRLLGAVQRPRLRVSDRIRQQEGFSIVEVVAVMLIIGILAAIAIPTFLGSRTRAFDSAVQANVQDVADTVTNWAASRVQQDRYTTGYGSDTGTYYSGLDAAKIAQLTRNEVMAADVGFADTAKPGSNSNQRAIDFFVINSQVSGGAPSGRAVFCGIGKSAIYCVLADAARQTGFRYFRLRTTNPNTTWGQVKTHLNNNNLVDSRTAPAGYTTW